MLISFHGAAETVTGSCHLIDLGKHKFLVDCGAFQGAREIRDLNYESFPFAAHEISQVLITHAHQDHIGRLPLLVRAGYQGTFLATKATIGLARISLPDAGSIQEEDARRARKHGSRHREPKPLFTEQDAYETLKRFDPLPYHQWVELPGKLQVQAHYAGHILGSAYLRIALPDGQILVMGGDLGRYNTPIIRDPEVCDFADHLVIESTYGDRLHEDEDPKIALKEAITYAVQERSAIIVPSFSIGRTQEILYHIRELVEASEVPRIPIFLDSPMAVSATELYATAKEEHDEEMQHSLKFGVRPLEPENLTIVRDREASKALNQVQGPIMIIAGSGMANGGRVQHHLLHRLSRASNQVLFTGFQAVGSLGRHLVDGASSVKLLGSEVQVNARIRKMGSLSAHADQEEMMSWLRNFKTPPKTTFLVHGEPEAQHVLKSRILRELDWNVVIPRLHEAFKL
jgi:metallo-beta-lactamase family protein